MNERSQRTCNLKYDGYNHLSPPPLKYEWIAYHDEPIRSSAQNKKPQDFATHRNLLTAAAPPIPDTHYLSFTELLFVVY
ncbi:hypothetical protein WCU84_17570 [Dickeya chrysanthemi]|uniref:Uncharacterized protein n=1 Tax=Dickeya chrysanthemi TaxID=556 RepID=A0ABU8JSL1_DICCH